MDIFQITFLTLIAIIVSCYLYLAFSLEIDTGPQVVEELQKTLKEEVPLTPHQKIIELEGEAMRICYRAGHGWFCAPPEAQVLLNEAYKLREQEGLIYESNL